MRAWLPVPCLVLGACAPGGPPDLPPLGPCDGRAPALEVAPPDGDFGELTDGADLWCGNPPQGGAPYTPFRLRIAGPEALADGVYVEMIAVDADDGVELAYTDLTMGLTCANVGESAGTWVGGEAHMRYFGWALEELPGRRAEVTIRASTLGSAPLALEERWTVRLVGE